MQKFSYIAQKRIYESHDFEHDHTRECQNTKLLDFQNEFLVYCPRKAEKHYTI